MKRILYSLLLSILSINAFAQIPTGYYSTATGTGATLKTQLKNIITTGHNPGSYSGLWTAYQTTDIDNFYENDGSVLDIYSENPTGTDPYNYSVGSTNQCGNYNSESDCYNREHIIPQSLFNEASPMVSDIHFIRATDGYVNNMRGSFPFGTVGVTNYISNNGSKRGSSVSPGYTGTVFEPINEFKGDVARMIFYFVTRYETQLAGFNSGDMLGGSAYPGLQTWELNQLLAWNALDPVSPAEIARNNASYNYQGNRNPYIDNPSYVNQVWGSPVVDTQAPTVATNLVANNPTSNSVSLNWTASTDNVGVVAYDIYKDGVFYATVSGTTATVSGLNPSTTYNFYVIAKDAAGNASAASNTATGTTLAGGQPGGSCGTEDFTNIPASASSYGVQTWTSNNITWTATDARTDQTINGRAINIRNGNLTTSTISGGIGSLTVTTKLPFSDTAGNLILQINGNNAGTIPFGTAAITTTISNINVANNVVIKIINVETGKRISIDDLSWTCYTAPLATSEVSRDKSFSIYPNPVKNNELSVKGENLSKVLKAEIYDLSGKLIQSIANPFKNSNKINLQGVTKGTYILKTDNSSSKFIVD
jgi:endonuclease I/chitodextrinase